MRLKQIFLFYIITAIASGTFLKEEDCISACDDKEHANIMITENNSNEKLIFNLPVPYSNSPVFSISEKNPFVPQQIHKDINIFFKPKLKLSIKEKSAAAPTIVIPGKPIGGNDCKSGSNICKIIVPKIPLKFIEEPLEIPEPPPFVPQPNPEPEDVTSKPILIPMPPEIPPFEMPGLPISVTVTECINIPAPYPPSTISKPPIIEMNTFVKPCVLTEKPIRIYSLCPSVIPSRILLQDKIAKSVQVPPVPVLLPQILSSETAIEAIEPESLKSSTINFIPKFMPLSTFNEYFLNIPANIILKEKAEQKDNIVFPPPSQFPPNFPVTCIQDILKERIVPNILIGNNVPHKIVPIPNITSKIPKYYVVPQNMPAVW